MMNSSNTSLTQSQLDFKLILNSLSDGMIITDQQFKILFSNRAFSTMSGIEASNLIGNKCHDVFPGNLCFSTDCPLTKLLSAGEQLVFDDEPHCKNCKHAPWIVTISAYPNETGDIGGYDLRPRLPRRSVTVGECELAEDCFQSICGAVHVEVL